jgi:predicted ATP-grasp superfamily ATP-dependent carboligase
VPDPERDWHEGRIQPANTDREQDFIDAVLRICEREHIDIIFPSNDPWVYVLSKNKQLLSEFGVTVPVPNYEIIVRAIDKHTTLRYAQETGFPTPRSYLPNDEIELESIAEEIEPPWVIKPRFTTGGRGLAIVDNLKELRNRTRKIHRLHSMPLIQEYIPGRGKQNFMLVLNRDGEEISAFTPRAIRIGGRVERNEAATSVSAPRHYLTDQAVDLLAKLGWWGGATVQTKLDARDGEIKLMEINPRLGTHLWYRTELGINEPLMCIRIAKRETTELGCDAPSGVTLVDPVNDLTDLIVDLLDLMVYRVRTLVLGRRGIDSNAPPKTLTELWRAYSPHYASNIPRRFSPYFRYALQDPLPAIIWISKIISVNALRKMKRLGR